MRAVGFGIGIGIAGAVVALAASLVSREAWRPGSITVPWGMVLGLVGSLAIILVGALLIPGGGFGAGVGWIAMILLIMSWHPGGDYFFADDAFGRWFLWGGLTLIFFATLASARVRTRALSSSPDPTP